MTAVLCGFNLAIALSGTGGYVLPAIVWVYAFILFYTASPRKAIEGKVMRYGLSRSFKVIEIGTNMQLPIGFQLSSIVSEM